MNEKQLYLKYNGNNYDIELKPFDETKIYDEEFLFKEAAIVILYPDGIVEAVKVGGSLHHTTYYKVLYEKSMKFKIAIDSLDLPFDWKEEKSTYKLDCYLSSLGISSLHNVNIHDIPFRPEDLWDFISNFYVFKAEVTTAEVEDNLNKIYDNYPSVGLVNSRFNSEQNNFKREVIEKGRRV